MKKVINFSIVILLATIFVACSSDGNKSNLVSYSLESLEIGKPVKINAGDAIVSASPDASIDIIVVGGIKTATLTQGSASIRHDQ